VADKHKPPSMQVKLNLAQLGIAGRLTLIALIAKFAPTSSQYTGSANFKQAVDTVVGHGPTLTAAEGNSEAAKTAAVAALVARDTETAATDGDLHVLKAVADTLFKTEADFHANGLNQQIKSPPAPLVPPPTVTVKGGKKLKGSILAQATRLPGLFKYICAISVDPITATSWTVLNGTPSKRTITGLVSGQGYWIRYCTERGTSRSDWGAPVYCVAS
jgi:hypothetical protein